MAEPGILLWSCVMCGTNPAYETTASSSSISKTQFCCPTPDFLQQWVQFQSVIRDMWGTGEGTAEGKGGQSSGTHGKG